MKHRRVRQIAGQKGGKSRSKKKLQQIAINLVKARAARWPAKKVVAR
jgi:hypothetical protein